MLGVIFEIRSNMLDDFLVRLEMLQLCREAVAVREVLEEVRVEAAGASFVEGLRLHGL